jgi:hypothetical protein
MSHIRPFFASLKLRGQKPKNFAYIYIFIKLFITFKYKNKWENGQKRPKPALLQGFFVAIFIFKSGQMAKKSGQNALF